MSQTDRIKFTNQPLISFERFLSDYGSHSEQRCACKLIQMAKVTTEQRFAPISGPGNVTRMPERETTTDLVLHALAFQPIMSDFDVELAFTFTERSDPIDHLQALLEPIIETGRMVLVTSPHYAWTDGKLVFYNPDLTIFPDLYDEIFC